MLPDHFMQKLAYARLMRDGRPAPRLRAGHISGALVDFMHPEHSPSFAETDWVTPTSREDRNWGRVGRVTGVRKTVTVDAVMRQLGGLNMDLGKVTVAYQVRFDPEGPLFSYLETDRALAAATPDEDDELAWCLWRLEG